MIHKFTDVEQLYWLCTKVSKNTKHISKLQGNYTLLLKTTLESLPALVDILKPFRSDYISIICKVRSCLCYIITTNKLYVGICMESISIIISV